MIQKELYLLLLNVLFGEIATQDMRRFTMDLLPDRRFRCVNVSCSVFATMIKRNVRMCQVTCLSYGFCKAASFYQSNLTCQLFNNIPDQRANMVIDADTYSMTVIGGTRLPSG